MSLSPERNKAQQSSRNLFVRGGMTITIALLLLTLLYLKAEAVSLQVHMGYTQQLRLLREADAKVDSEVLAARLEISRNYDALTSYVNEMKAVAQALLQPPSFLRLGDSVGIEKEAAELLKVLHHKADLIDSFKSYNAIVRNSMAYFLQSASGLGGVSAPLKNQLESYVRQALFFARDPDPRSAYRLHLIRLHIETQALSPEYQRLVNTLFLHGGVVEEYLPKIDQLTDTILGLENVSKQRALLTRYLNSYENSRSDAQFFRNLLYLFGLITTAYLINLFIRLELTRRSLKTAHTEVTEHYQAQLRAEQQLRLHDTAFYSAHEGISLTDAHGKIMDVNPAFSRITGYQREEVLGRNPKVLKSGKHDETFYTNMWDSINNNGNWRGEIWNRNKYGEIYPQMLSITTVKNTDGEVSNYVAVFSDISRLKEQEVKLQQMAYYDALTGLPNRVLLTDRMDQAIAQTRRSEMLLGVCFLDLDGFKPVNDTFGHDAGDRLLMEVANRISVLMRGGDTVARLGGDEFAILLQNFSTIDECRWAVQRVMKAIAEPAYIDGDLIKITASVGVTVYPQDQCDGETLLRHADQAMYQAKQQGKDCIHWFDHQEDNLARSHHERISRIETALNDGELLLHYQPKVDLRQGKVVGLEALIRWQHPDEGMVPPLSFLPAIEEHGLIVKIGQWVIYTALAQLKHWNSVGLITQISVNIASRQLQSPNFVTDLQYALSQYPTVDPAQLELEVLETAALEDIVSVSRIIENCRDLGLSFAIDDFGTGYSSLTYLKRLPASALKIDRSFVQDMLIDPENLAIVQGIMGLTQAFQMKVIAEGVETAEHGQLLLQLGCDLAQGFGIAKPMAAEQVVEWVANWTPDPLWQSVSGLYWDDGDYPIFVAQVEHHRWVAMLVYALENDQPIPHKYFADHSQCHFGEWYYGPANNRYDHIYSFHQIEPVHQRVHDIAKEMDRYIQDGKVEEARELVPELLRKRDEVIDGLRKLAQAVAMVHPSITDTNRS